MPRDAGAACAARRDSVRKSITWGVPCVDETGCLSWRPSGGLARGWAKPAPEAPAVDVGAEAQAIRDRSAAWMQLAQAKDAAGIVNGMYTADGVALFDGDIRKGTAELQAGREA